MTLFIWDTSHYDGLLPKAVMVRAKAEGIVCVTAKIGEGLADTEGTHDDTALAAARDAGIEFIGGYMVPRTGNVAAQVDYLIGLADKGEPWWRGFPGWFFQVDLERWPYDNVSAATGIDFARRLRDKTQRQVALYASHGQYQDQLAAWDGPLWNADYVSRTAAGAVAMYPGDGWQPLHGTWRGGWAPYSGKTPTILQYTSSAVIAGLTTCDANAFRGTVDEFRALIGGADMTFELWDHDRLSAAYDNTVAIQASVKAGFAGDETRDKAATAAIQALATGLQALATGGTTLDTAAVVTAVQAVRDEARTQFGQLHTENAALKSALDQAEREVARLTAALAAGAQAEAATLTS